MFSSFPVPELDDAVIKLSSLKIMTVASGAVKTFSDLNYLSKSNVLAVFAVTAKRVDNLSCSR